MREFLFLQELRQKQCGWGFLCGHCGTETGGVALESMVGTVCVAAVALVSGQVCDHRKHSVQNTHLDPVVGVN